MNLRKADRHATPLRSVVLSLFLVSMATLAFELLLTRIFSVTMWYHFAFMAISLAVFGLTAGALSVYLLPRFFKGGKTRLDLTRAAACFAASMPLALLVLFAINFKAELSIQSAFALTLIYTTAAVPFFFSGVFTTLALTRYSRLASTVYASDLAGAACGCVISPPLLSLLGAPQAVIAVSVSAAFASLILSASNNMRLFNATVLLSIALISIFIGDCRHHLLKPGYVKGEREERILFEKWNAFSRIRVMGDPRAKGPPQGWGLSRLAQHSPYVRQLRLDIDSTAATVLTGFEGNAKKHQYLALDVSNFAHYLKPGADVLVLGAGGGRDILSALVFKQKSVTGVEINPDILLAVNGRYGDFTGHLDLRGDVRLVNGDARVFAATQKEKFDIIQMSLVDTWAATSTGAMSLAENSLYTVEAWRTFLRRLKPGGILSCSRWYVSDNPFETMRLVALAREALRQEGNRLSREHMLLVVCPDSGIKTDEIKPGKLGVATLLVGRDRFTQEQLAMAFGMARMLGFEIALSSKAGGDAAMVALSEGAQPEGQINEIHDLSAPTDDRPFFFQSLKLSSWWSIFSKSGKDAVKANTDAVSVLVMAAFLISVLSISTLSVSRKKGGKHLKTKDKACLAVYFVSIGLGYIFVEMALIQRLTIFVGNPLMSLTLVLSLMLLSSGVGSLVLKGRRTNSRHLALMASLIISGAVLLPPLSFHIEAIQAPGRILLSVLTVILPAFFMGAMLPSGLKAARILARQHLSWFWALNGAASAIATVFSVIISLQAGILATYSAGCLCYVIAITTFHRLSINEKLNRIRGASNDFAACR